MIDRLSGGSADSADGGRKRDGACAVVVNGNGAASEEIAAECCLGQRDGNGRGVVVGDETAAICTDDCVGCRSDGADAHRDIDLQV